MKSSGPYKASLRTKLMEVMAVKNLPAVQETWVQFLGWEDPLEKGKATRSSILAWRIPMDRGAWVGGYSPWAGKPNLPLGLRGKAGGCARVTAGPKRPHLGVCPVPNIPLQGRQGSRGCIPGSPGESGLVCPALLAAHIPPCPQYLSSGPYEPSSS